MKKNWLLVALVAILCLSSGCFNSEVRDLKSDLMKGGPAIIGGDHGTMQITFAYPTTTAWTLDINNSVIKHDTSGVAKLIWEQNQYQKERGALGFKVHRADNKSFQTGHYTFKMSLIKDGIESTYEGEFNLQYDKVMPIGILICIIAMFLAFIVVRSLGHNPSNNSSENIRIEKKGIKLNKLGLVLAVTLPPKTVPLPI